MTLDWQCKHFNELSAEEIYQVLRLRIEVFIVEQNCPFQDADNKDQQCYHLCGYHKGDLAAYVRIVPPGLSYKEPSIGRVVTSPAYRGTGAGKALMTKAIEVCSFIYHGMDIHIGAQLYLKKFYESLGFKQCSDIYLEDGIEHIGMMRDAAQ